MVAFKLPALLRRFTAEGTMTAAFLPTLAKAEAAEGEAAVKAVAARFLGTLLSILLFTLERRHKPSIRLSGGGHNAAGARFNARPGREWPTVLPHAAAQWLRRRCSHGASACL